MDADRDFGRTLSGFGAFMLGALTGLVVSAAVAVAVILASPPPAAPPVSGRAGTIGQPQAVEGEPFVSEPPSAPAEGAVPELAPGGDEPGGDEPGGDEPGGDEPGGDEPGQSHAAPFGAGEPEAAIAAVPRGDGEPQPAASAAAGPELPQGGSPEAGLPETAPMQAQPAETAPPGAGLTGTGPTASRPAAAGAAGTFPSGTAPTGPEAVEAEAIASDSGPADTPARTDAAQGVAGDPAGLTGERTALADNASQFDAPRQSPLLAVVLVGDAVAALTADRLALLTMPLTVAVPPDTPGAALLGAGARAAGHEVLADLSLASLPAPAGEAGPAEAAAQRVASLDVAVGATATDGTADAGLLAPVLAQLDRQGLAWVDASDGIGTPAEDIARDIGMPYARGSRIVPGGADPDRIYREIDSAARQARQWGTAVLFLHAGEPALQALVRWGLEQQAANRIWFAPISAVIERRAAR